jgi:hypothetical protein
VSPPPPRADRGEDRGYPRKWPAVAEQVQVVLLPAHRDLDDLVQLVQGRGRRQMDAPRRHTGR